MEELEKIVQDSYSMLGLKGPSPKDLLYLLRKFDFNEDQSFERLEVKLLLQELGGLKFFSSKEILKLKMETRTQR